MRSTPFAEPPPTASATSRRTPTVCNIPSQRVVRRVSKRNDFKVKLKKFKEELRRKLSALAARSRVPPSRIAIRP